MSTPHIAWAFKQRDLHASERLVLLALAERANGERFCFPSIDRIADDCEISRRATIYAVERLAKRHLIEKVTDPAERLSMLQRAGASARCKSTVYRILRPLEASEQPIAQPRVTPEPTLETPPEPWHPELVPELAEPPVAATQMGAEFAPQPANPQCIDCASADATDALESLHRIPKEERTSLREETDQQALAVSEPPEIRKTIFSEGLKIVRDLTGLPDERARRLVGRMVKTAHDDCERVMAALRNAADHRPIDPIPFIMGSLCRKPRSAYEEIREQIGFSLLFPVDDPTLQIGG